MSLIVLNVVGVSLLNRDFKEYEIQFLEFKGDIVIIGGKQRYGKKMYVV